MIGAATIIKAKSGYGNLCEKKKKILRRFDRSSLSLSFSLDHIALRCCIIVLHFPTFLHMGVV